MRMRFGMWVQPGCQLHLRHQLHLLNELHLLRAESTACKEVTPEARIATAESDSARAESPMDAFVHPKGVR